MSTPLLAATADHGELENKNYLLACDVYALVAATADHGKLGQKKIIHLPAMSTPLLAATADHGELGHNNYWLACCDVYTLVGCDR